MADVKRVVAVPVTAGGAFAAGDAVGGKLQFVGAVDFPGKGGKITGVTIIDKDAQALGLTLQLFVQDFTPTADNAAFAPSDADADKAIANVVFVAGDYAGGTANKVAYKDVDIDFETIAPSMDLFGQLFTQGAPTYSVGGLTVILHIIQEERAGR